MSRTKLATRLANRDMCGEMERKRQVGNEQDQHQGKMFVMNDGSHNDYLGDKFRPVVTTASFCRHRCGL